VLTYDANGAVLNSGTFGHGLQHVQANFSGDIWVGYSDVGIHSSWCELGEPGLVRFDAQLNQIWSYSFDSIDHAMSHCALNVEDELAVAYFNQEFQIARIRQYSIEHWSTGHAGAMAILMRGDACALVGGYGADLRKVAIGALVDGRFERVKSERILLPGSTKEVASRPLEGRGQELHTFVGQDWLRWSFIEM
jgi:hypothetical protein